MLGLRRRRHPARRVVHRPRGWHDLRRRAQRGGQVHLAGQHQRAAAAAPRPGAAARRAGHRPDPAADPGPGRGACAAAAQPVPGHDRGGEPRPRRLHHPRPRPAGPPPRRGARDVPRGGRLGAAEGRQPVRRPAAAGRVRPLPDARPVADHPGRAVDGPGPQGAAHRVRRGHRDEPGRQDRAAGRAERARGPAAGQPRGGAGERPGAAGRPRPRRARAPRDRGPVPRRHTRNARRAAPRTPGAQ